MAELDEQGEAILSSLKEQYPSLTIDFTNGAICVRMPGFWTAVAYKENGAWVINDHVRKILPNYVIFKELEASLIADASNRGAYILVNDETSKFLHETHDSAWRGRTNDLAFIGRIGTDDSSGEILALGAVEKPEKFDNLADRQIVHVHTPHSGVYCNRSRRWLCVSLQLEKGNGYRREYFLLDTGSPKSILITDCAVGLVKLGYGLIGPIVDIEGVDIELELQPHAGGDARTRGINLLGTDFLNSVVLIDDFMSKNIMVLKRATPSDRRL